jgi:predicted nucleotidyltransferase
MTKDWIGLCFYPETKFRIIQHFVLNPELRQNQTQLAHSLHLPQVSISRHISELVSLRILHEERYGKAAVYWLNSDSALVKRLLTKIVELNRNFISGWVHDRMKELTSRHRNKVQKVILFGSLPRGEFRPSSDIDVLVIVSTRSSELEFELQTALVSGGNEEGLKINLQIESKSDYVKATGDTYLGAAKKEGIPIWPNP